MLVVNQYYFGMLLSRDRTACDAFVLQLVNIVHERDGLSTWLGVGDYVHGARLTIKVVSVGSLCSGGES